jgi:hypothetical protein
MVKRSRNGANKELDFIAVLPETQTKNLTQCIKRLSILWAQEEQLMGNQVFCKFYLVPCLRASSGIAGMELTDFFIYLQTGTSCLLMKSRKLPTLYR